MEHGTGLEDAVAAAGGIDAFAARLGMARRTVFLWKQAGIPAERVPEVEAATGIPRARLRPDLWPETAPAEELDPLQLDPLQAGRANVFALLGHLLSAPPEAPLLRRLAALPGDASPLGAALAAVAEAAGRAEPGAVAREYHDLFIGVGRGELLPYASYYLTGFLHERPLAELRAGLARLGLERADGVHEPEDHIAFLCEAMAGLLRAGRADDAEHFFRRHVRPWAMRCFADLELAGAAVFYRPVAGLGRALMDVELAAAELQA